MSKQENITKAREHYLNRKLGRPKQIWVTSGNVTLVNETIKGALPVKL